MSTQTELLRLSNARDKMRNKMVNLGIGLSTDKLDSLAEKLDAMPNNGAVSAEVQEGASYTIPAGYHNGSGVVKGVSGGGNYQLQAKEVTPTKSQQAITSDEGYYGLSGVTVAPIPDAYQDVSATTAEEGDVLATKIFIKSNGEKTAGTMPNVGQQTELLDTSKTSVAIPKGYHDGTGSVRIDLEDDEAEPTDHEQTITPATGKVLNSVVVKAIPAKYGNAIDTSVEDANKVLAGTTVIMRTSTDAAVQVDGAMPNNGKVTATIDGMSTTSYTIPKGYHDGTGKVSLTDDIERALAAI